MKGIHSTPPHLKLENDESINENHQCGMNSIAILSLWRVSN